MKNVMCILAIVMSLVGSANLAMAQSTPDLGANTGSEANRRAIYNNGEYTGPQAARYDSCGGNINDVCHSSTLFG
jgi:hypothetical protein